MDKIDIHNTKEVYDISIKKLKKDISPENYKLITDFLDAQSIGKTSRIQTSLRARLKNMYLLKVCALFFKKPLDTLELKDIENLVRSLNEDKLKKQNKKPFAEKTKSNFKACLILFLKYALKNDKPRFVELTSWIDTKYKEKEIPAIMEEDIKKMLNSCVTLQQKVLVAFLFDSGARIEEFLNLRLSDIIEVKGEVPYYRINIRNETSKTQGRTIGLFWKPTTEIIKEWLNEHPDKHKLSSQFYPSTYDSCRIMLHKIGMKALRMVVNPHILRHSSATYYAGKGNDYFQLCKRYGWKIGSDVPHIYIDRSGIREKEVEEKFKKESLEEMREQFEKMREAYKIIQEEKENFKKEQEKSVKEAIAKLRIEFISGLKKELKN